MFSQLWFLSRIYTAVGKKKEVIVLKWNQAKHAYSSSSVGVLIRACAIIMLFLEWSPGYYHYFFAWHWIISHTHNNVRTQSVLWLYVFFCSVDAWQRLVKGRIYAMEQEVANTCQSLNFEFFTSLWLALPMRMTKWSEMIQRIFFSEGLLNHRDGNR